MSLTQVEIWRKFNARVSLHVVHTTQGHYATGGVEPMDLIEAITQEDFAIGSAIKYLARYKRTKNKRDLYKAAHYLSRIWWLTKEGDNNESDTTDNGCTCPTQCT